VKLGGERIGTNEEPLERVLAPSRDARIAIVPRSPSRRVVPRFPLHYHPDIWQTTTPPASVLDAFFVFPPGMLVIPPAFGK